jgi:hypothetical protein
MGASSGSLTQPKNLTVWVMLCAPVSRVEWWRRKKIEIVLMGKEQTVKRLLLLLAGRFARACL